MNNFSKSRSTCLPGVLILLLPICVLGQASKSSKSKVSAPAAQSQISQPPKPCADEPITPVTPRNRVYKIGRLLHETDTYQLYGERKFTSDGCWYYDRGYKYMNLVLVFKVGEDFAIENNEVSWKRFNEEILPVLQKIVPNPNQIGISIHVDGQYLDFFKGVLEQPEAQALLKAEHGESDPLILVNYEFTNQGPPTIQWLGHKSISAYKEFRMSAAAEKVANEAEKKRQQELKRQQSLAAKRPVHRTRAASILRLLPQSPATPPAQYDFSKYLNKDVLNNIYVGQFFMFTEEHDPEDVATFMAELDAGKMLNVSRLRAPLMMAQSAYHLSFKKACSANNSIPWVTVRYTEPDIVTRNGWGTEISRIEGSTFEFQVREPFARSFLNAHKGINSIDGIGQMLTGVHQLAYDRFKWDFNRFLEAEGCDSLAVRQFEVNLYLATEWLLPLQELVEQTKPVRK